MAGRAISASMAMEAAITPTQAAIIVPIITVIIARPPLNPPSHRYKALYILSAIPERSSMDPIKTNRGTAKMV
ncbi:hypothetical protein ES703_93784 [subsurface metagenome]